MLNYPNYLRKKTQKPKTLKRSWCKRGKGGEEKRAKYVTTTQHMKSKWKLGILLNEHAEKNRTI